MSVKQTSYPCRVCGRQSLFQRQSINHTPHLILSIVTAGLWLIPWGLIAFSNRRNPMRCVTCGSPPGLLPVLEGAEAVSSEPAWHPDPHVPGQQRYWDGQRWTEHTA